MSGLHQFLDWFTSQPQNGSVDLQAIEFVDLPGSGRGAVALKDLPEGFSLFSIPRELTLSTRTSTLPAKLGDKSWRQFGLHRGWTGLILCMMWEESLGFMSKWHSYLSSLPTTFDTPMFWNDDELAELKGTAIVGKIGKIEAEQDFHQKLIPAVTSRPDLFPPETLDKWYTVERYHIMGSRILSRSFQVENCEDKHHSPPAQGEEDTVDSTSMDVDQDEVPEGNHITDANSVEEDDDDEDTSGISMVPMADLLNAQYGCNNARLFDNDPAILSMTTIRPIKAGEQIWNTYGDLPNSDLLRRYGHVDMVTLPEGGEGNPADIVELPASLVVSVILSFSETEQARQLAQSSCQERIDWWLDEAGDDTFILETNLEIPHPLISLVRLLLLSDQDWQRAKSKQKLPKPKVDDEDGAEVLKITILVAQQRLDEYPTTIEDDEQILVLPDLAVNNRNAVVVRSGEKRILKRFIDRVTEMQNVRKVGNRKRKDENSEAVRTKRSKR